MKKGVAYLGVDIGTSSLAVVAVDADGHVLAEFTEPNPCAAEPTASGRAEQDADRVLAAADALIVRGERSADEKGLKVADIGWTGQMHGVVAVDRKLKPLTPFVTWRDRRCAPPALGSGAMDDFRRRKVRGVFRVLTLPGLAIARRTGKPTVDPTFRASLGSGDRLKPFLRWLPEADEDAPMLGDNQAGVYAALKLYPSAAVANIGTSGQLSVLREKGSGIGDRGSGIGEQGAEVRPFPGGRELLCRASHVGGAALAKLRKSLGWSWKKLNDRAASDPRVKRCVAGIVDDLAKGVDLKGIRTVVGIGNALRLNPCLVRAIERRLKVRCVVPEAKEMAAYGAALFVRDRHLEKSGAPRHKRSLIAETLRHEIMLGKYAVHAKFPSEQMLARRFGVARPTVSAALAELKRAGLIRVKFGSGAFVTPKAKGNGAIGLIVPGRGRGEIFEPICRTIEREVDKIGYTVVSTSVFKGSAEERKRSALAFASRCAESHVAGVILEPVELLPDKDETTEEILSTLKALDIPVVLIDRDISSSGARSDYDLVGIDNVRAGYQLGAHMVAAGARRIAFLAFAESAPTVRRRRHGVAQAVLDAGLPWSGRNVLDLPLGDAHRLAKVFAGRNPPDALVCANDRTATFAVRTLSAIGLRVPRDVRVSGFDDLGYSRKLRVPLTTVRQPCEDIGRVALRTLVERILHRDLPPREIILTPELVVRKSSGGGGRTERVSL